MLIINQSKTQRLFIFCDFIELKIYIFIFLFHFMPNYPFVMFPFGPSKEEEEEKKQQAEGL